MSTKQENINDPNSCWNRAAEKEPLFILRATDSQAPTLIRLWAEGYKQKKKDSGEYKPRERAKYINALKCAEDMESFIYD